MRLYSNRAGTIYHVQSDYDCYVPKSLTEIKINYDEELINLLSEANKLIGRLDGIAVNLPDKDIFISKYVEKEAVVSSQIEGTQASLSDVFQFNKKNSEKRNETEEIVGYIHALNYGINLLESMPISVRYFKQIHKELLKGVRDETKSPGEIRRSQNWIGPNGCTLLNATFVPPSVDKMEEALYDLELYMNSDNLITDPLLRIGLIHYQFETIHPFLDENGRLGRLMIPLWLKENNFLQYPLLYLSLYFKQNRTEYYGLLMDVRFKGKYEEWLKFFLKGIIEMSHNSIQTIEKISSLIQSINEKIMGLTFKNKRILFDTMRYVYRHPYFDSSDLINELKITKPTASSIIKKLVEVGVVSPTSTKQRYVTYKCDEYISILEEGTEI
ncbi:MAG: Fic family protein [Erysipelotrichales bacterium]|nr:Fic family protein [Erysipelotrichales bacterium]